MKNKTYLLQYGSGVAVLPVRAVTECVPPDGAYLRVLLFLCAQPVLLDAEDVCAALAAASGVPQRVTENALAYWEEQGILLSRDAVGDTAAAAASAPAVSSDAGTDPAADPSVSGSSGPAAAEDPAGQKPEASAGSGAPSSPSSADIRKARTILPEYTPAQVADAADRNPDLRPMLDLCEQTAGKLFSEHENAQVTALFDCYGLDTEFIVDVFGYCREKGHQNVAYVVRTALGMYDEGIRTPEALNERIKREKLLSDSTSQIRRIFGMGERTLTAKEKQFIDCWVNTWQMPVEVIRCAYEATVDQIEHPSMSYINKILSRWNDTGIRTEEAVRAAEEAHRKQLAEKQQDARGQSSGEHSFNAEEFLDLAMKRTFKKEDGKTN